MRGSEHPGDAVSEAQECGFGVICLERPTFIRVKGRATPGLAARVLAAPRAVPPPGLDAVSSSPAQCVEEAKRATSRFCRVLWKSKVITPASTIEARLINNWTVDPTASLGTK